MTGRSSSTRAGPSASTKATPRSRAPSYRTPDFRSRVPASTLADWKRIIGENRGRAKEELVRRRQELVRLEERLPARVPRHVPKPRPAGLVERLFASSSDEDPAARPAPALH